MRNSCTQQVARVAVYSTGIAAQNETAHDKTGISGVTSRNAHHLIHHSVLLSAAAISSFGRNHRNKYINSLQDTVRIRTQSNLIKHEIVNETDNVLLASIMVEQIMVELSGAATERERAAVTYEDGFS